MTAQTFKGFLLTRNWRDTRDGIELEFWFSTDQGPLCAVVRGERSVFFLAETELARRGAAGRARGGDQAGGAARLSHGAGGGLYFRSYRQARRCADDCASLGWSRWRRISTRRSAS